MEIPCGRGGATIRLAPDGGLWADQQAPFFPGIRKGPGCSYGGGVNHPGFQIDSPLPVDLDMKALEHLVKRSAIAPITKALINRRSGAEALRHIAPGSARAEHPKDAVERQAIICSWAPATAWLIEDICNQIPGCVGEFVPFSHREFLPLMVADFTESQRSWN
jgi:hypothetical protein